MSRAKIAGAGNSFFAKRFIEVCGTAEPAIIQRSLNISYQAAKNYLNGRLPDARVLLRIAERTPYSLHWLLTGEGDKFASPVASEDTPILARQISELIRQEVEKAVARERTAESMPRIVVLGAENVLDERAVDTDITAPELDPERLLP